MSATTTMTCAPASARPTDGSHLPLVHLNGTGRQALLDQLETTYRALDAGFVALVASRPHPRDDSPLGESADDVATAEHTRRLTIIRRVRDDVMADWLDLQPCASPSPALASTSTPGAVVLIERWYDPNGVLLHVERTTQASTELASAYATTSVAVWGQAGFQVRLETTGVACPTR